MTKKQAEKRFFGGLDSVTHKRLMAERERLVVMNADTGEVVEHYEPVAVVAEGTKKQAKVLSDFQIYCEAHGGFVMAFFEYQQTLTERLPTFNQSDLARLLFIATYTSYPQREQNFGYLKHDNGHYIDKAGLEKILDMSNSKFRELYGKLIAEKVIEEHGDKLAVNPTFFFRGDLSAVKPFVEPFDKMRVFRGTVRSLYREFNGRQIKHLGLIYAVLPFVHFKYNVICHNTEETQVECVKPLTLGTLAELLGYSKAASLRQAMRRVRHDGKPVFQFVADASDARTHKIIVNPAVVYAGGGESLDGVRVLFNDEGGR